MGAERAARADGTGDRAQEADLVRPFVLTQGRTRTTGVAVPVEAAQPSSAEISAELDLPVGVVRVLVGDLVAAGLAHIGPTARSDDIKLVRRLIDGVRRL